MWHSNWLFRWSTSVFSIFRGLNFSQSLSWLLYAIKQFFLGKFPIWFFDWKVDWPKRTKKMPLVSILLAFQIFVSPSLQVWLLRSWSHSQNLSFRETKWLINCRFFHAQESRSSKYPRNLFWIVFLWISISAFSVFNGLIFAIKMSFENRPWKLIFLNQKPISKSILSK